MSTSKMINSILIGYTDKDLSNQIISIVFHQMIHFACENDKII